MTQLFAISQAVERDALQHHVVGLFAGLAAEHVEWVVLRSQKASQAGLTPGAVAGLVHQRQVWRDRFVHRTAQARDPSAGRRPAAIRSAIVALATGQTLVAVVAAIG